MKTSDTFLHEKRAGSATPLVSHSLDYGLFWYGILIAAAAFDALLSDWTGVQVSSGLLVALLFRLPHLRGTAFAVAFVAETLFALPAVGPLVAPLHAAIDLTFAAVALALAMQGHDPGVRVRSARALVEIMLPALVAPFAVAALAALVSASPLADLIRLVHLADWPAALLGTAAVMPVILLAGARERIDVPTFLLAAVGVAVVALAAGRWFPFPFIVVALPLYIAVTRLPPFAVALLGAGCMVGMVVFASPLLAGRAVWFEGAVPLAAALSGLSPSVLALLLAELRGERRRLAAASDRLRRVLDGIAGHGFCMLSRDGFITGWNDTIADLVARPAIDAVDFPFATLFSTDERDAFVPAVVIGRATASGRADHDGWCQRGDGSRFWAHFALETTHGGRGEVAGFVVSIRDDSELQRSQSALLASERRWGFALASAGQGVWEHDLVAGRMHYSAAYTEMLGLKPGALGDEPAAWKARVHPDDVGRLPSDDRDDTGGLEFRLRHADGHWIWIADRRRVAERDETGRPISMMGTHTDVTQRRQAEIARELSEARYRMMAEHMIDIVAHLDLDWNRLWISPACRDILGYEPSELIGQTPAGIAHPDDLPEIEHHLQRIASGTERVSYQARYRHADGHWIWLAVTLRLLREPGGAPVGILSVSRDVTHAREVEEALKASEATFRGAMESASIGMVLEDLDGRWHSVNRALCDILGQHESDLIGQDGDTHTVPDDIGASAALRQRLIAGEIPSFEIEKRLVHKSGRIVWTHHNVSLDRGPDGQPRRLIRQIQDVTERRRVELMKSEFISTVSHELRTPLTSIRGALGLVLGTMTNGLPPAATRLIDIAHKNCDRLIPLINDILDLDKIESGLLRVDLVATDAARLVAQAVDGMRDHAERNGVVLQTRLPEVPTPIRVDEGRFLQIVTNLLSNAIKFSPTGASVEIEVTATKRRVCVAVCDHGPGISEEFRPRIFGRFAQADSATTRAKGGSGLGLHICRRLATLMGGAVEFESTVGLGSVFWVEFPLHIAAATPQASPPPADGRTALTIVAKDGALADFLAAAAERVALAPRVVAPEDEAVVDLADGPVLVEADIAHGPGAAALRDRIGAAGEGGRLVVVGRDAAAADSAAALLGANAHWTVDPSVPEDCVRHLAALAAAPSAVALPCLLLIGDSDSTADAITGILAGRAVVIRGRHPATGLALLADHSVDLVLLASAAKGEDTPFRVHLRRLGIPVIALADLVPPTAAEIAASPAIADDPRLVAVIAALCEQSRLFSDEVRNAG